VPDNISALVERLLDADKRLSEWRHSAACAGADTALQFMCSWYESLDLESLHNMCADAPTDTVPEKITTRRARAYRIASYASTSTFIPPPADFEEEFTNDEEAKDGEEEEEEAGNGEAQEEVVVNAPEEPAAGNPEQAPEEPVAPEQAPERSSRSTTENFGPVS
jgi:hypothetical protein